MNDHPSTAAASPPWEGKVNRELWAGMLVGPFAWMLHFQTAYALVPWVCKTGHASVLHVLSLVCLLLALSGGWLSRRCFRGAPGSSNEAVEARPRFMAILGIMSSGLFSLVILAQAIATFMVSPCPK